MAKTSIFDLINALFEKRLIPQEEFGRDAFRLLRFLSMEEKYIGPINDIQKYQGVLGFRIQHLLHAMLANTSAAPFITYVKKETETGNHLSEESIEELSKMFRVSKKRMREYLPSIWATDEEIKEVRGLK